VTTITDGKIMKIIINNKSDVTPITIEREVTAQNPMVITENIMEAAEPIVVPIMTHQADESDSDDETNFGNWSDYTDSDSDDEYEFTEKAQTGNPVVIAIRDMINKIEGVGRMCHRERVEKDEEIKNNEMEFIRLITLMENQQNKNKVEEIVIDDDVSVISDVSDSDSEDFSSRIPEVWIESSDDEDEMEEEEVEVKARPAVVADIQKFLEMCEEQLEDSTIEECLRAEKIRYNRKVYTHLMEQLEGNFRDEEEDEMNDEIDPITGLYKPDDARHYLVDAQSVHVDYYGCDEEEEEDIVLTPVKKDPSKMSAWDRLKANLEAQAEAEEAEWERLKQINGD
jgi:hypothetical protein